MITTPEAYVHLSTDETTLTFYYDTLRADRNGETWGIRDRRRISLLSSLPAWAGYRHSPNTTVFTAVFDASFHDFCPTTTAEWFYEFKSLKSIEGLEHLNTSQVTDMGCMFSGCESLTALDLTSFDTSNVASMSDIWDDVGMFSNCKSLTSLDLTSFDTSKVTDMRKMFSGCESLTSLDLSSFDTSVVWGMSSMFSGCASLTALDLSSFDTSKVRDMEGMFYDCSSLTSLDLSRFDTSKVTSMSSMFRGCESLTTIYCNSSWSAGHSDDMFSDCNSLRAATTDVGNSYDVSMANPQTGYFTKNVLSQEDEAYVHLSADKKTLTFYFDRERNVRRCCAWPPGEVASKEEITQIVIDESYRNVVPKTTASWFEGFSAVTEIRGLDNLNTSEVTDMSRMFAGCSALRSLDVSRFDTSQVTGMSSMFSGCASLTELDLYFFDTAKVTDMHAMFSGCATLSALNLAHFDTAQVTNMGEMFADCSALVDLDISRFDTAQVKDMHAMFSGCATLSALNLAHFDTAQVRDMHAMFSGCAKLSTLNLAHFDTAQVTDMHAMFKDCKSLTTLDLSNFQTSEVKNMSGMFSGCSALTTILSLGFRNCFVSEAMFCECTSLQGAVNFNENCTDARMANPERGYFSKR